MTDKEKKDNNSIFTVILVRFLNWILDKPRESLSILGLLAYFFFRIAFLIYYNQFGVTPEEVGLDFGTVLIVQLTGSPLIILAIVSFLILWLNLVRIRQNIDAAVNSETDKSLSNYYNYLNEEARKLEQGYNYLLIGIPLTVFIFLIVNAIDAGVAARQPSFFDLFQGRAIQVEAMWLDPPGEEIKPRAITHADLGADAATTTLPEFLLLGDNDGIVVLYDQDLGAVRIPKNQLILVSLPEQSSP